jgi:CRP/FNR family transcriptional regulator, cyclic AMP receptor protein
MSLKLFNYEDPTADIFKDDYTILSDLLDAEWTDLIACMERQRFPANARILQAGASDRSLYLIATGNVKIIVETPKGPRHIASIGEGSVFGEMAFFDGAPRSAHVFADQEVEVLSLSIKRFEEVAAWHPHIAYKLLMDLGRVLSRRLRRLNQGYEANDT